MSADAIDNGDDESYLNLDFFLPDAPTVDVAITTRCARAAEVTTLDAIEVREMETKETMEWFRKCAKLQSPGVDMKTEILQIVMELGKLALAIMLAGSYVAATPRPGRTSAYFCRSIADDGYSYWAWRQGREPQSSTDSPSATSWELSLVINSNSAYQRMPS